MMHVIAFERRLCHLMVGLALSCLAGCLPITVATPLTDIETSTVDEKLIGKWKSCRTGKAIVLSAHNGVGPSGLMHFNSPSSDGPFTVSTIGEYQYANIFVKNRQGRRECYIVRYQVVDNELTIWRGSASAFTKLLEDKVLEKEVTEAEIAHSAIWAVSGPRATVIDISLALRVASSPVSAARPPSTVSMLRYLTGKTKGADLFPEHEKETYIRESSIVSAPCILAVVAVLACLIVYLVLRRTGARRGTAGPGPPQELPQG
jgi:hypothetical protein